MRGRLNVRGTHAYAVSQKFHKDISEQEANFNCSLYEKNWNMTYTT